MNWKTVKLGEVAGFVRGITFKPADVIDLGTPDSVGCMRTKNVQEKIDLSDVWGLPRSFVKREEQVLQEGDMLVSSANSWNLVGKCCWVPKLDYPATAGGFITILRAKPGVDERYLYHWFSSVNVQAAVRNCGRQTTNISNLDLKRCLTLEIPLPPLSQQQRIAARLDAADRLRALRRDALARLDDLAHSLFLEMFGDPAHNPMNWPVVKLGELTKIRRGASPRPIANFLGGTVNWIKIGDGSKGSDTYLEECAEKVTEEGAKKSVYLRAGSVIFANCGVSLGFARILKVDGCIHDGWLALEDISPNLDKLFLLKTLNAMTQNFRAMAPDGTQPNLNTSIMKNFAMFLPPLALQRAFAERLQQIETVRVRMESSALELDALFASLQSAAFDGQ